MPPELEGGSHTLGGVHIIQVVRASNHANVVLEASAVADFPPLFVDLLRESGDFVVELVAFRPFLLLKPIQAVPVRLAFLALLQKLLYLLQSRELSF